MSEIKPCPFCGGEARRFDIEDGENAGGSCVSCTRCLASGHVEFGRKENFVTAWNNRAIEAAEADLLGKALEALRMARPSVELDLITANEIDAILSQAREVRPS